MPTITRRFVQFAILGLLSVFSTEALSHQIFLSSALITEIPDRQVKVQIRAEGSDLSQVFSMPLTITGGIVNPHILKNHETEIADYLLSRMSVANLENNNCQVSVGKIAADFQAVVLETNWNCSAISGELFYQTGLFFDLDANAGQLVFIAGMKNETPPLLNAKTPKISITGPPPTFLETTIRFLTSGIQHIFIGFDHIAFLIVLLLWAQRIWTVIKIVTSFTVAHTITLTLATLDIFTLPSLFVEAAIAATIVYAAAENLFRRDIEKRWIITFFLGLIHGFGFATVLQEFGLPDGALVTALAMFNIGVEFGQLAIVGIFFPLLIVADHFLPSTSPGERNTILVHTLSGFVLLLGIYWFVERVFWS